MTFPTANPYYATLLAQKWKVVGEANPLAHAFETRIRHSWAASCSRKIFYSIMGVQGEPYDETTYHSFGVGSALHDAYQKALQELHPEAEIEVKVRLEECDSSGHIDAVVRGHELGTTSIEIKTINGTGYKKAIGCGGPASGPRRSALVQGAVNAYAIDADRCVIVYLPLEVISKLSAQRYGIPENQRHAAEWVYTREEYEPIALAEIARWKWINECVDKNVAPPKWIPDPELPERSVVTNPRKGEVVGQDGTRAKTWQCGYCEFQEFCNVDP